MNLSKLKDHELLSEIKILVQNERDMLTSILHHLREVERRRLFSDLKYPSLFDYAMKELKYSEGQANRRIKAMRLLKELPQLEDKIQSGSLNLSNLVQAQTFFRAADKKAKIEKAKTMCADDKLEILELLENKSARDGEKLLFSLEPNLNFPLEKARMVSETHSEIRFTIDKTLREHLEQVRTLLGLKGLGMSFAELTNEMAIMSIQLLKQKSFGKKRAQSLSLSASPTLAVNQSAKTSASPPTLAVNRDQKFSGSLSRALKHNVWIRDGGKCTNCSSISNLNFDHVHPKALGGANTLANLRLLCFHCNQRRASKTFGIKIRSR